MSSIAMKAQELTWVAYKDIHDTKTCRSCLIKDKHVPIARSKIKINRTFCVNSYILDVATYMRARKKTYASVVIIQF
jgi:hypothetical protein